MSKVLIKKSSEESEIQLNSQDLRSQFENGTYKDSWVLGYIEEEKKGFWNSLGKTFESVVKEASPLGIKSSNLYSVETRQPQNIAYVGVAGTGKSMAMISALTVRFCSNSHQDIYLLAQPNLKSDYEPFFSYRENVSLSLGERCCDLVKPVHDELQKRIYEFAKAGVDNLVDYERKETALAKIFIVIIDFNSFHSRLRNIELELLSDFLDVVKKGNKYGIYCIISNEELHRIPEDVLSNFQTINLFTLDKDDSEGYYLSKHKERQISLDYGIKGSFFSDKNEQLKTFASSRSILIETLRKYGQPLENTFLSREITKVLRIQNGLKSKVRKLKMLLHLD